MSKKIISKGLDLIGIIMILAGVLIETFTEWDMNLLTQSGGLLIFINAYLDNKWNPNGEDRLTRQLCVCVMVITVMCIVLSFIECL